MPILFRVRLFNSYKNRTIIILVFALQKCRLISTTPFGKLTQRTFAKVMRKVPSVIATYLREVSFKSVFRTRIILDCVPKQPLLCQVGSNTGKDSTSVLSYTLTTNMHDIEAVEDVVNICYFNSMKPD